MKKILILIVAVLVFLCAGCAKDNPDSQGFIFRDGATETYVGPPGSAWQFAASRVDDEKDPPLTKATAPNARIRIITEMKAKPKPE